MAETRNSQYGLMQPDCSGLELNQHAAAMSSTLVGTSAKPFTETSPEIAQKMRKNIGGRPKSSSPKVPVSIRLDQDVVAKFKATGPGWQSRINEVLRKEAMLNGK